MAMLLLKRQYELLLFLILCLILIPSGNAQACDVEFNLTFFGVEVDGYGHSTTFKENGPPVSIIPDQFLFTSTNNIRILQVDLG